MNAKYVIKKIVFLANSFINIRKRSYKNTEIRQTKLQYQEKHCEALQHLGQYLVPRRWKNSSGQKNAPNPHNFGAKIPGGSTAL